MVQAHGAARTWGMHETDLANVDAPVGHAAPAAEEHQVAGGEVCRGNARALPREQVAGGARQADGRYVPVGVIAQPAAVEAAVGRIAARAVGRADQADGADG